MAGLFLLVVGVGEEDAGEPIEAEFAVGLGIIDRLALSGRLEGGVVGGIVQRPRYLALKSFCSAPNSSEPQYRPFFM